MYPVVTQSPDKKSKGGVTSSIFFPFLDALESCNHIREKVFRVDDLFRYDI
jgi:hypothetical protein